MDTVRIEVWGEPPEVSVTVGGFRVIVGSLGKTVADRSTSSAKSLTLVTVIIDVFEDPWAILKEGGLDVIVNP